MPIPAYQENSDTCVVCGEVCCERDAVWVVDKKEKDELGLGRGDQWVCRDCAEAITDE
jgi:hypothetical protein